MRVCVSSLSPRSNTCSFLSFLCNLDFLFTLTGNQPERSSLSLNQRPARGIENHRCEMSRSTTPASLASSRTAVGQERTPVKYGRSLEFDRHTGGPDRRRSSVLSLITASSDNSGPTKKKGSTPPGPPGPGGPNSLYQPKTLKFWLILVSNFLAMFLVALDRTIVATAIPQITDDFHSLGDIGWYESLLFPLPYQVKQTADRK